MALSGTVIDNGWAQLGIALLVAIGLPALVADRLLPPDAKQSNGVVSDVYSLIWVGIALLFVGLTSLTGDMLRAKAASFHENDHESLAELTMWVAGPGDEEPAPVVEEKGDKAVVAAAPISDAGPIATSSSDASSVTDSSGDAGTEVAAAPPKKESYTPAEIFKDMSPAVVSITVQSDGYGKGGGTGFIIDKTGIVVTNHHVIDGAKKVWVKLLDGKWASDVEILTSDSSQDLAVLRITTDQGLHLVGLGDSDGVQVGERAISIGNPLGLEHTLTDGLVSARRTIEGRKMIQMSTPISPGNSGGPLFNLRGEVIGVSTASLSGGFSGAQNLNLAVPINQLKAMLKDDYPDKKRVGGGSPSERGSW
jgi:V8-like Glu-specific endopeptidase